MQDFNTPFVIEHGDVWYRSASLSHLRVPSSARHVCSAGEELAIVHDGEILHHAGSSASAERWMLAREGQFAAMNEKLREMGDEEVELFVVRMPVAPETVLEMNKCLAISGRVSHIEENLLRAGVTLDPYVEQAMRIPR